VHAVPGVRGNRQVLINGLIGYWESRGFAPHSASQIVPEVPLTEGAAIGSMRCTQVPYVPHAAA
jgi:hypothetical protein